MTNLERIAEWRKGCSCDSGRVGLCPECTKALIDAIENDLKSAEPSGNTGELAMSAEDLIKRISKSEYFTGNWSSNLEAAMAESVKIIEVDRAAQRQAGREEAKAEWPRIEKAWYDSLKARYAAVVDAASDVEAQFHAQEVADRMEGRPVPRYKSASIYLDIEKIRKALADLDEARKQI